MSHQRLLLKLTSHGIGNDVIMDRKVSYIQKTESNSRG